MTITTKQANLMMDTAATALMMFVEEFEDIKLTEEKMQEISREAFICICNVNNIVEVEEG